MHTHVTISVESQRNQLFRDTWLAQFKACDFNTHSHEYSFGDQLGRKLCFDFTYHSGYGSFASHPDGNYTGLVVDLESGLVLGSMQAEVWYDDTDCSTCRLSGRYDAEGYLC